MASAVANTALSEVRELKNLVDELNKRIVRLERISFPRPSNIMSEEERMRRVNSNPDNEYDGL